MSLFEQPHFDDPVGRFAAFKVALSRIYWAARDAWRATWKEWRWHRSLREEIRNCDHDWAEEYRAGVTATMRYWKCQRCAAFDWRKAQRAEDGNL